MLTETHAQVWDVSDARSFNQGVGRSLCNNCNKMQQNITKCTILHQNATKCIPVDQCVPAGNWCVAHLPCHRTQSPVHPGLNITALFRSGTPACCQMPHGMTLRFVEFKHLPQEFVWRDRVCTRRQKLVTSAIFYFLKIFLEF